MEVTLYKDLTWEKIGGQISTFNKQNEMCAHLKNQFLIFFVGEGGGLKWLQIKDYYLGVP